MRELSIRNNYWSKKIKVRGYANHKTFYFGKADDVSYEDALTRYKFELPYLRENLDPYGADNETKTIGDLADAFLEEKEARHKAGNLAFETLRDYRNIAQEVVSEFGRQRPLISLTVDDFQALKKRISFNGDNEPYSVTSINRKIGYLQSFFRYAVVDNRMINRNFPMQSVITRVSKKETRKHRANTAKRLLTADEIKAVLSRADVREKAMILLAINGGYNNSDIAKLKVGHFRPMPSYLEYERRKTYIERVTPLWAETKNAIQACIDARPAGITHDFLFWKSNTNHYFGDPTKGCNGICKMFTKLLKNAGIYEAGKNFGALRTTFANVGSQKEDDLAIKALMGHEDGSTLYSSYASRTYKPRLTKITDHVHDWLFGE